MNRLSLGSWARAKRQPDSRNEFAVSTPLRSPGGRLGLDLRWPASGASPALCTTTHWTGCVSRARSHDSSPIVAATNRNLDRGNPHPGSLGEDFGRLGLQFQQGDPTATLRRHQDQASQCRRPPPKRHRSWGPEQDRHCRAGRRCPDAQVVPTTSACCERADSGHGRRGGPPFGCADGTTTALVGRRHDDRATARHTGARRVGA